jgi:hypothetical protein
MNQTFPETEESEASREGTASHELAASMIVILTTGRTLAGWREKYIGNPASNGVIITEEIFDGAELFALEMQKLMIETRVLTPRIEQKVKAPRIHELSEGTPDFWLYDERNRVVYIRDYKFGHRFVSEFENWQMINYASGILEDLDIDGLKDQETFVDFGIIQPRAYHRDGPIRSWRVLACELRGFINQLHQAAHANLDGTGKTQTGPHCRDCIARHGCPAALQAGVNLFEIVGQPVPTVLPMDALATQFSIIQRARKQLEYLETGFEEQIKSLIREGKTVPGYRIEPGQGRKRWSKPINEVIALGELLGIPLKKDEAVTPNQAKALGVDENLINTYSEIPNTGLKLVPDEGSKARRIFSKL